MRYFQLHPWKQKVEMYKYHLEKLCSIHLSIHHYQGICSRLILQYLILSDLMLFLHHINSRIHVLYSMFFKGMCPHMFVSPWPEYFQLFAVGVLRILKSIVTMCWASIPHWSLCAWCFFCSSRIEKISTFGKTQCLSPSRFFNHTLLRNFKYSLHQNISGYNINIDLYIVKISKNIMYIYMNIYTLPAITFKMPHGCLCFLLFSCPLLFLFSYDPFKHNLSRNMGLLHNYFASCFPDFIIHCADY